MVLSRPLDLRIPPELLPADGRFGSGPSKVRPEAVAALAARAADWMGTSHRQAPVKRVVGELRAGLRELFSLPDGWEVVLGNGGSTAFWDVALACLVERRSQHLSFGEFGAKFAAAAKAAPFLDDPDVRVSDPWTHAQLVAAEGVDVYATPHNETSTGVALDPRRPDGADPGALVLVDATSAAGAMRWDPSQVDTYYFAPQKAFAADGGLWAACCSPLALERAERLAGRSDRWVPASLDLRLALDGSRQDQTYNTPALATLFLFADQVRWLLERGGLAWAAARCEESSGAVYAWAEARPWATPFVPDPADRSPVVTTVDLDPSIDAGTVSAVLRSNGVVDTESYRKLGRNQLRLGVFPAVEPDDVRALLGCIDHVVERLADAP